MPAYSFKANIHNQSSSLSLRLVDSNACEGGYTDGWGAPPATIPSGQSIAFQAESTGPLRGCKGYVKYEVGYARFDGTFDLDGYVCFFWDVPVLGNSISKLLKARQSIDCDCDGNMSAEDDPFGSPPLIFDFGADDADGVPNDGHGHDSMDLYLTDEASTGFSAQPITYTPFTIPTSTDWEGHWATGSVDIVVNGAGGDTATVQVKDTGVSPPISLSTTLDLSKETGPGLLRETLHTARSVIGLSHPLPSTESHPASSTMTRLENPLANPVVPLHVQNVLHLDDGVVLTLMNASDAGGSRGTAVHYQIVTLLGKVTRDLEVGHYTPPPR